MQKSMISKMFKSASRALSLSSSSPAAAATSVMKPIASSSSASHVSSSSVAAEFKPVSRPSLRMRIIVDARGIVRTQELSYIRPPSVARLHTSAVRLNSQPFVPLVNSENEVYVAGTSSVFNTPETTSVKEEEFQVGDVQTASNVEYSSN